MPLIQIFIIQKQQQKESEMDIEQVYQRKKNMKKIRLKISTNRNIKFITAIKSDATISDLANRALSAYLQIIGQTDCNSSAKKQLTVSAVKQGIFYMPKSQNVANLLNPDDEVEVIIIKAKPKYPNQSVQKYLQKHKNHQNKPKILSQPKVQDAIDLNKKQQEFRLQFQEQKDEDLILNQQKINKNDKIQLQEVISNAVKQMKEKLLKAELQSEKKRSKKQKKKEKKKLKELNSKQNGDKIEQMENAGMIVKQTNEVKDNQMMSESFSRKKISLDPIVIPSPKITFHSDPKIQSPRISLNDSIKKKVFQKQSEEAQRKNIFDKTVSPISAIKSPTLIIKTPLQLQQIHIQTSKKEKDQFYNFSLPRKSSEDKKQHPQFKKQEPQKKADDKCQKKQQKQKPKVSRQNSGEKQAFKGLLQRKSMQKIQIVNESRINEPAKEVQANTKGKSLEQIKAPKKMMIVQQQDSDSDENKKTNDNLYTNPRQKQLNEILAKINKYKFSSSDQSQ